MRVIMGKIKTNIVKTVNRIHLAAVYSAMAFLVGMAIITIINVFMRYVMNTGIRWAEEVAKLFMAWFTFIAMAIGVKQGLHISLHLLPRKLPSWIDRALILLKDLTTLTIAVVFFIYGIKLVGFTRTSIMPATEWPSFILYLILPIASVLIAMEVLMDIFQIDDHPEVFEMIFKKGVDR